MRDESSQFSRMNDEERHDRHRKSVWIKQTLAGLRAVLAGLWKLVCGAPKVVLATLAALAILAGAYHMLGSGGMNTNISSDTVAIGLRNIGEIATQSAHYKNVQVIENAREIWGVQIPFTQSRYIFSYDGVIKAGMDFSEIDVQTDDSSKTFTVTMPDIQIFSNEIDANSLKVYDEQRNIFTPLYLDYVNESLQKLKDESQEEAVANGILEEARENARTLIKAFLHGIHEDYEVICK